MENEIWRDIPGYEGLYQASNLGRIRGLARYDTVGRLRKEKIKKPQYGKSGYYIITLCKKGVRKTYAFARIIWESFNGPVPEGMQLNHINEDKTDNRLENLNLMTPKENCNWGTRTTRAAKSQENRKDLSKEVEQYDLQGNLLKVWPSAKEIQRCLGFPNTNISACCNKTKYHEKQYAYGFIWKRKEVV